MSEGSALVYFANCKLLEVTTVLLENTEIKDQERKNLEQLFWEQALHRHNIDKHDLGRQGWEQSWGFTRLLRLLHAKSKDTPGMVESLASTRKEINFISLLQALNNLSTDVCKELKALFSKVLLAQLITRTKTLPKLSDTVEQALLQSLISRPHETCLLLELISCQDHPAFTNISQMVKRLHFSAVVTCMHTLTDHSILEEAVKKAALNNLYALLLLMPVDDLDECDSVGCMLYEQCRAGTLDFTQVLMITASCCSISLNQYLVQSENRRLLRHITCTSIADIVLTGQVFDVVTDENKLNLDEMCLRTLISKTHWVEDLIGLATQFVISKDEDKLEALMEVPALWLGLAINIWTQFPSHSDIMDMTIRIIDICQKEYPTIFFHLKNTLARLKKVTDWLHNESPSECLLSPSALLSLCHSHSVLYLLQATTRFQGLDHGKLHNLLCDLEGPKSWNVRVFEGFTVLLSLFNTLVTAVDIFNEYENKPAEMHKKYMEMVSKPIIETHKSINNIEPLNFRIEIMEDIFMLLFVRPEHYCEDKGVHETSTDDYKEGHWLMRKCSSDGEVLKATSLPSTFTRKASLSRMSSSSSYPSTSQRRHCRSKVYASKNNQGFVCYPWLVNDILVCLEVLLDNMDTVCDQGAYDKLIRLKKSVEDARWRLDILTTRGQDNVSSMNRAVTPGVGKSWVYPVYDSSSDSESSACTQSPVRKTKRQRRTELTSRNGSSSNTASAPKTSSSANQFRNKKSSRLFATSSNVINLMLSSPENLVTHFIAGEDLVRATNIVEKFNLRGTAIEVELHFLKEFCHLRKCLASMEVKNTEDKSFVKESALQAISESTSSGVLAVSIAQIVEKFFAVTKLPDECVDNRGVVVLDLALSLYDQIQVSTVLLTLAFNYFNSSPSVAGLASMKALTMSLRRMVQGDDEETSIQEILLDPSIVLKGDNKMKQMKEFWKSLEESVSQFTRQQLCSDNDDLLDVAFLRLTTCVVSGQGLVQNYQSDTKHHYLNQLRLYLACLWKFCYNFIPHGTRYDLLYHSLDKLVGKFVFVHGNNPTVLETALRTLPLNVEELVIANCVPLIHITPVCKLPSTIVLNNLCSREMKFGDDNVSAVELVSSLLSDLLYTLESRSSAVNVQRALDSTSRLRTLDWTQLTSGEMTYVFLVNLYNLMYLHALLVLEHQDRYGLVSESSCLRRLSAKQVVYQVGQWYVSLSELQDTLTPFPAIPIVDVRKSLPVSTCNDPRAIFLLANHYADSPAVKVFSTKDMDKEVDARVAAFVQAYVDIYEISVGVPEILIQFINHVSLMQVAESERGLDMSSSLSQALISDFLKETIHVDIGDREIKIKKDIGVKIVKSYHQSPLIKKHMSETYRSWKSKKVRPDILKYLVTRNPLLSLIVEKLHCIESEEEGKEKEPTLPLERLLHSKNINSLAIFHDQNVMLATLEGLVDREKLWLWLDNAVEQNDWHACLEIMTFIPEKQFKSDPRFSELRFWILQHLSRYKDGWKYCQNMPDARRMYNLLHGSSKWSLEGCITMFHIFLSMDTSSLPAATVTQARQLQTNIETASKVREAVSESLTPDTWVMLGELLQRDKVALAMQWYQYRGLTIADDAENTIVLTAKLVASLLERGQHIDAHTLLTGLPAEGAVKVCNHIVSQTRSVASMQYLTQYLHSQPSLTPTQVQLLEYLDIGVAMLSYIPLEEQEHYRSLVSQPELVVEQLLMLTRISTLEMILHQLSGRLSLLPPGSVLSSQRLDALFRRYAAKAVDMRIRTKLVTPRLLLTPNSSSTFSPPDVPPTKLEWVGNDEVTECMCCESTVFSMFNRRHHCRRCGRVICNACSPHRFKVTGYGNVKVRICDDCCEYISPKCTNVDVMSGPRTVRTESHDSEPGWYLTSDLAYNGTLREEFTYSHAPSIALCLSILKLHTERASLHRFLFSTIESMLQLLRPITPGTVNPEVDYSLLVNMIKTLVEFSKVSCSQYGSASDWETVDGLCAEVDMLALLVGSTLTVALLPVEPLRGQSALSNLRENLLRNELWTLALEVSTKAGLDYNSVWIAWGKACLKAGAWTDARDKFSHCGPHRKDSQLLSDIMQILQDNPQLTDLKSRLNSLKALSSKTDTLTKGAGLDPRVYEECLYYLRTYGTHASTLTFYLNQNDMRSAVYLLLESPIDIQTYLQSLFLPALQMAKITNLYRKMAKIDKTLIVFKEYLEASCSYCQRHHLYNVLYHAQVWMCDYVRASMTCVHLFRQNARTYSNLADNRGHLEAAISHMEAANKHNKETRHPLVMQLPPESIAHHMFILRLQLEVLTLLAAAAPTAPAITVFGSDSQRIALASIVLTATSDLQANFTLAARIAQGWRLGKSAVLCPGAAQLVKAGRTQEVLELIGLVPGDTKLIHELISAALKEQPPQPYADQLIALMTDVTAKISGLIDYGHLKSAYLLAVKYNKDTDVRRILEAAERLDQPLIKKICLKKLNMSDDS